MNCFNCNYVVYEGTGVKCNRELLTRNFIYTVEKPEEPCPCHSEAVIEESRYGFPNMYRHESDDVCVKCKRIIPNGEFIPTTVEDKKAKLCRICGS